MGICLSCIKCCKEEEEENVRGFESAPEKSDVIINVTPEPGVPPQPKFTPNQEFLHQEITRPLPHRH